MQYDGYSGLVCAIELGTAASFSASSSAISKSLDAHINITMALRCQGASRTTHLAFGLNAEPIRSRQV